MASPSSPVTTRMAEIRHGIDHWRSTRRKHSPMPTELWTAAVSLARVYGVSATSRALTLSYGSLKDRMVQSSPKIGRRATGPVRFVELDPGSLVGPSEPSGAVLELCAADGAKLVLRLRDPSGVDLAGLAEAFWRRRS